MDLGPNLPRRSCAIRTQAKASCQGPLYVVLPFDILEIQSGHCLSSGQSIMPTHSCALLSLKHVIIRVIVLIH
eukprot:scaffold217538_cov25-Prasinocladus_malaysianus.AAC.2